MSVRTDPASEPRKVLVLVDELEELLWGYYHDETREPKLNFHRISELHADIERARKAK